MGGGTGIFTDPRDGQTYNTVVIGEQEWFANNLNYYTDSSWCYEYNDSHCINYGRLYKWSAATIACPYGWHLPTDNEWKELEIFLGMSQSQTESTGWRGTYEGKKLKSETGWNSGGNGTDEVAFSALPGGGLSNYGNFDGIGRNADWWSATKYGSKVWYRLLTYDRHEIRRELYNTRYGFSVRCVRD